MKILLISNGFPPRHWAGTETYTAGIAMELSRRDHQVQVLCGGDWNEGSEYWNGYTDEHYHGIAVRRVDLNWTLAPDPFRYSYNNPVIADFLSDYLDEIKPDLVHVTSCDILSASVLKVIKDAGLPLVLSLTDFWFLCPRWNLLRSDGKNCTGITTDWECLSCNLYGEKAYRWPSLILPEVIVSRLLTTVSKYPILTRQRGLRGMAGDMADRKSYLRNAIDLPDVLFTASAFVRKVFHANGIGASIRVQSYGHDLSWIEEYTGKTKSGVLRFGFIGQIAYFKGVHILLKAACALVEDGLSNGMSLSIFGDLEHDKDYSSVLMDLVDSKADIKFCGTYAHNNSSDVFTNIDVLVVPSLWYDFPLVIQEAFATKTPVIATNLGGMAEAITHEVNGLLFERDDANHLAKQMKRIMEERDLLEQLKAGIPQVKSIQEEATEFEAIYHELIQKKK